MLVAFSVAQVPALRTHDEPEGVQSALAHWGAYLARGNGHARFTADIYAAATASGALCLVENH